MAKMKVHELAKEVEMQSKEIIAFLQDKGYEVKAAQSGVEDDAIALVRSQFGKGAAAKAEGAAVVEKPVKTESAATEAKAAKPESTAVEEKPVKAEKAAAEEKSAKAETPAKGTNQEAEERPKKKKKIIFVSNPHNSKMPGNRPAQPGGDKRPSGGNNRPQQQAPHQIIRPTQKPIPALNYRYRVDSPIPHGYHYALICNDTF